MKHIILLIIMPLMVACQQKTNYPTLIDKETTYTDTDFDKEHFDDFSIYEDVTTKNSKLSATAKATKSRYPWDTQITEKQASALSAQIENSITAVSDGASDVNKTPSTTIYFSALVDNFFTKEQLLEYKNEGHITTEPSVLDNIKATIKSYDLINEKNEKIKFNQDVLGLNNFGLEEKDGKLYEGIAFTTLGMGDFNYLTLKGFVEIEVTVPSEYQKEETINKNIGDKFSIGNQQIQILEFDANVMHYKKFDSDAEEFSIYVDGCNGNFGTVQVPEEIYTKFRNNQGLNYPDFLKKHKEFGFEKAQNVKGGNFVSILKCDVGQLQKVIFYIPDVDKVVKKTIRVPVNIEIK